jgi:endonuclease-3
MARQGRRRPTPTPPPSAGKVPVAPVHRTVKRPFDVDDVFARIEAAVRSFPKAAMFELHELGHTSVFEQLVACVISIRTLDEVSGPAARRLFEVARTPADVARLGAKRIDALIGKATFHEPKARTILEIARRTVADHGGELPCDPEVLMSFSGVGPKCAHLALGVACRKAFISVDVHVHRVTNRWGYVAAATPEKTLAALEAKLPRGHWIDINRLLVPFGKHVCTGKAPRCSTCPVLEYCRQVGVTTHR